MKLECDFGWRNQLYFRTTQLTNESGNYPCRPVNHPLVPYLETSSAVAFADELYNVCPVHDIAVSAPPCLSPASLEPLERASANEKDRAALITE